MENARIIIIEDDPTTRADCKANLEVSKHTVVAVAGSVDTAMRLVDHLTPDDVDCAIVDGNLSATSRDGADGERVAEYIHARLRGVVVIGFSLAGEVRGADMNVDKGDAWALDTMIREL